MVKIIKPKVQTVYKVCKEENGKFYSSDALGYLRHEYAINKTTRPKPELAKRNLWLYAFDNEAEAIRMASNRSFVIVMECLADNPIDVVFRGRMCESVLTLKEIKSIIKIPSFCVLNEGHTYITPQKIIWEMVKLLEIK